LEEKFSVVPEEISGKIQEINERETLRQLLKQAIRAYNMEEFKKSLDT
jgi:hypothetical protein